MAILKAEYDFNLKPVIEMERIFPQWNGRFLSLIGKRARKMLKMDYLSGQDITLKAYPKDAKGRYTITSDVNRRQTEVKIYSYPVNLFERGRILRSGEKEAGRYIITKKLKMAVMSNTGRYSREFEEKILKPELKRLGL